MINDTRLVVFDLDGTLIDSRRDLATAVNLMRRELGRPPLPMKEVMGYIGGGLRVLVERSLHDGATDIEQAVRICYGCYLDHLHDETTLYEGVKPGLEQLREHHIALAVMTNKPAQPTRLLLQHFDIERLFAAIVGGDEAPELKPAPAALQVILSDMDLPPGQACMVGDHTYDLQAARRAGMQSVFVEYGIGHAGKEKPTHRCASFGEVVNLFLS